jgi:hypothetical protein
MDANIYMYMKKNVVIYSAALSTMIVSFTRRKKLNRDKRLQVCVDENTDKKLEKEMKKYDDISKSTMIYRIILEFFKKKK